MSNNNVSMKFINDIVGQTKKDSDIIQILKGAHVQLCDNDHFYHKWTKKHKDFLTTEYCSHNSLKQHYRIQSDTIPEILFGTSKIGTWVQLENYPASDPMHLIDYFKYILSGKNRGPFGSSTSTDKKPLVLKRRKSPRKCIRKYTKDRTDTILNLLSNKRHKKYMKKRINARIKK
jgi:hypothetical protein